MTLDDTIETLGTTPRSLLLEAAQIAEEDDEPGVGLTAENLAALLRHPGVPVLDYWQNRNFTEVLNRAHAYAAAETPWLLLANPDVRDMLADVLNDLTAKTTKG